jgi:hypothetical protein
LGADPKKKAGGRGPKWRSREDECLAEAWKTVSINPFTGTNQNAEFYWKRVKVAFDERRLLDPYFKSHRWHMIQHAFNKWHGFVEEVHRVHVSGTNFDDQVLSSFPPCIVLNHQRLIRSPFLQMRSMITAYREDNDDAEFKFMHVFAWIEKCDKCTEVRTTLAKANASFDPNARLPRLLLAGQSGTRKLRR